LDIWTYTGYTLEELEAQQNPDVQALLNETDVLVDGPFILEQRDLTLPFRGSQNQRLIDMVETRKQKKLVLKQVETDW
jgi:anaerobic ribonucleoside-triphosphate reductase activating protein